MADIVRAFIAQAAGRAPGDAFTKMIHDKLSKPLMLDSVKAKRVDKRKVGVRSLVTQSAGKKAKRVPDAVLQRTDSAKLQWDLFQSLRDRWSSYAHSAWRSCNAVAQRAVASASLPTDAQTQIGALLLRMDLTGAPIVGVLRLYDALAACSRAYPARFVCSE